MKTTPNFARAVVAIMIGAAALFASDGTSILSGHLVTSAEARIGRPLTPLSYAGVARRTTRRAYYGTAAVAGAAAVAASRCVQVVDAYGRIITRCY